jgi:hypothetical protein
MQLANERLHHATSLGMVYRRTGYRLFNCSSLQQTKEMLHHKLFLVIVMRAAKSVQRNLQKALAHYNAGAQQRSPAAQAMTIQRFDSKHFCISQSHMLSNLWILLTLTFWSMLNILL